MKMKGKKFIASYSGGKDSVLSIYRAINLGLIPQKLITTYNTDQKRSWFHGIPDEVLSRVSESLKIPVSLIRTSGDEYEANFEKALIDAKNDGAEVCVFGDIDIEEHLEWCSKRCENTGLIPFFPLWKENRKSLVYEFINSGFSTLITIVDTTRLDESLCGRILTKETADEIEAYGADICGENGEYHTFVFDGPIFSEKIRFTQGEKITSGKHVIVPVLE